MSTATMSATKEKPILFSGPMVQAILAGQKTQTRRVVTAKQMDRCEGVDYPRHELMEYSPYGRAGDRLWVRETWRPRYWGADFEWMCVEYRADKGTDRERFKLDVDPCECWPNDPEAAWDKLSLECINAGCQDNGGVLILAGADGKFPVKWRPSIFMPRAASRLLLRVRGVRVEPLQDIQPGEILAEGIPDGESPAAEREAFQGLWDGINGKRGYGWDKNPLVWVVEFEVEESKAA